MVSEKSCCNGFVTGILFILLVVGLVISGDFIRNGYKNEHECTRGRVVDVHLLQTQELTEPIYKYNKISHNNDLIYYKYIYLHI